MNRDCPITAACASSSRSWVLLGFVLWAAYVLVICGLVIAAPTSRSLIPLYAAAALGFWQGHIWPANFHNGYYYLPASEVLFTPFAYAGSLVGGLLWRLLAAGLLTLAAWRWARIIAREHAAPATATVLALLISSSAGVLRNGQFDGVVSPLFALAAAYVAGRSWWSAAFTLGSALALKPTGIVPILLMGSVWPRLGLRLLPILIAVLALPFINLNWPFVSELYVVWMNQLLGALAESGPWNDLPGALAHFGVTIPHDVTMVMRAFAALGTLALALLAARRLPRAEAAFTVLSYSTLYLLLFNPRTEGSAYVGLGLIVAPVAVHAVILEGRLAYGVLLGAMCIAPGLAGLTPLTLRLLGIWFRPLLALILLIFVVVPRSLYPGRWPPPPFAPP